MNEVVLLYYSVPQLFNAYELIHKSFSLLVTSSSKLQKISKPQNILFVLAFPSVVAVVCLIPRPAQYPPLLFLLYREHHHRQAIPGNLWVLHGPI